MIWKTLRQTDILLHRGKGQSNNVSNGHINDMNKDAEFDNYIQSQPHHQQQPQQQGYGAPPIPGANDPYYYPNMSFPYVGHSQAGMNDGAWSTGGDAMFSVGGYDYTGMFGFGYPQFSWDFAGGDYWSAAPAPPQQQGRKDYNDYYRTEPMPTMDPYAAQAMNGEMDPSMKAVEQGLKGMNIVEKPPPMQQVPPPPQEVVINQHVVAPPPPVDHMCQPPPPPMSNNSLPPPPVVPQQPAPKKSSWAAIASQPARPQPPMQPRTFPPRGGSGGGSGGKHNMDIGMWDGNSKPVAPVRQPPTWSASRTRSNVSVSYNSSNSSPNESSSQEDVTNSTDNGNSAADHEQSDHGGISLASIDTKQYNPSDYTLNVKGARFFIIKSYSEDDIHRSIKYNIWCSTEHGNKRLDAAFREREGKGSIYLLYSVNGSGHFCGVAQMLTLVDYGRSSSVWAQDKWKGQFQVKWIYVKDVPNSQLRYIRLENNDNKPVTNSRDTQEVPLEKGKQMLKIIHNYSNSTSIFDDFQHYERRQEDDTRKVSNDRRPAPRR